MILSELIAALEATTEPSRELDGCIFASLHPNAHGWRFLRGGRIKSTHGLDICESNSVPLYTASLDAALTLMPPGWDVREANSNGGVWMFVLGKGDVSYPGYREAWSWPGDDFERGIFRRKPAAIALCIAALRAREQTA